MELQERPEHIKEETKVIVTFLNGNELNLRAQGIDEEQAAELRARLVAFAEDWNAPEMDIYDNYDAAKSAYIGVVKGECRPSIQQGLTAYPM
ncbi:MAG TPA: hypothetical protein VFB21_00755 [Chthonomonadaceae bacterium]|nr:hypothetical protein [Chthonomonadaceae bacterium]